MDKSLVSYDPISSPVNVFKIQLDTTSMKAMLYFGNAASVHRLSAAKQFR